MNQRGPACSHCHQPVLCILSNPKVANSGADTAQPALRAEFYSLPPEAQVDRSTVAAVRYVTTATLEAEAIKGGGPPYTRIGRRALYRKGDVLEWMQRKGRKVENTAQLHEDIVLAEAGTKAAELVKAHPTEVNRKEREPAAAAKAQATRAAKKAATLAIDQ